jgi:hypothetical protein
MPHLGQVGVGERRVATVRGVDSAARKLGAKFEFTDLARQADLLIEVVFSRVDTGDVTPVPILASSGRFQGLSGRNVRASDQARTNPTRFSFIRSKSNGHDPATIISFHLENQPDLNGLACSVNVFVGGRPQTKVVPLALGRSPLVKVDLSRPDWISVE